MKLETDNNYIDIQPGFISGVEHCMIVTGPGMDNALVVSIKDNPELYVKLRTEWDAK